MGIRVWRVSVASLFLSKLFFLSNTIALAQQAEPTSESPPVMVQPGAPGQAGKIISPADAAIPVRAPSEADISFMQGMIMHHSQAVEMTALLGARGHNKDLLELGKRISISQTDEMKYMQQWLEDRGQPVSVAMKAMGSMDHSQMHNMDMGSMGMMPGMLTPQQMETLRKGTGREFDRLFLTGMIQHHTGALVMVQDLFDTPGAGQDAVLFDFATDVDNTQRAEINIMQGMLRKGKK
jgi:uncharacterized protein (DUF305 family)